MPENPRAWLVSAGHFKAPDTLRRDARYDALDHEATGNIAAPEADEPENIEDDRLRLIFTCCHPALNADAQAALTLREVCALTSEKSARACLTPAPTMVQRIARAKAKKRDAKKPYQVPSQEELPGRCAAGGTPRVQRGVCRDRGRHADAGEFIQRGDPADDLRRVQIVGSLVFGQYPPLSGAPTGTTGVHPVRRATSAFM